LYGAVAPQSRPHGSQHVEQPAQIQIYHHGLSEVQPNWPWLGAAVVTVVRMGRGGGGGGGGGIVGAFIGVAPAGAFPLMLLILVRLLLLLGNGHCDAEEREVLLQQV